ncbi:MAG: glycoside hydrolase family 9 protein [Tannerellaceae bacterium]|jgi:hypothetical protein|nr:glycoside hydrolase family 9 protein [Tannerellaceae bacterium]
MKSNIRIAPAAAFCLLTLLLSSCFRKNENFLAEDIPSMPIQATYEHSLEYAWSQKEVLDSVLLSDMESMDGWTHKGYGYLSLSEQYSYKGQYSLLLTSPTKGTERPPEGRPWGVASAVYPVDSADWTDWNRLSFWIYPDLQGFKVVSVSLVFHNEGEDKVPDAYERNGLNYQVLENNQWNKVCWEIAHLGREKVTGLEIRYRLQGNEPGATDTARYFIDELYLEKVDADHFEGWDVAPGEIAYNHAGYVTGFPKEAFVAPDDSVTTFSLREYPSGKLVMLGEVVPQSTPTGHFHVMDFSRINTPGEYRLKVGALQTKPFRIGSFAAVYRSSIIKTVNHFYGQSCGCSIEGVHDACHQDWVCVHNDGRMVPIHGGWHDAGDLSQGLVNTAEAVYAMLLLADKIKDSDPELSELLLDEAEWGLDWMLKTRFGDGFRSVWATKDMWTDNIIGSDDDFAAKAQNSPHANLISATTEATAAFVYMSHDSNLAAYALDCAVEDFNFATAALSEQRMNVELAGAALNAALALYKASYDPTYETVAMSYADYIVRCQQQEDLEDGVDCKGFFYRDSSKETILHYPHRSHEQDAVVGLVMMATLYPNEAEEWNRALELYADFYKKAAAVNAPYYMIPAGIYDLTKARDETEIEQIRNGVGLTERYYLKRFPVWTSFRGNSGTTLTQAKGLAVVANYLGDEELKQIAYRALNWHLGMNPFAQSLMYGEGYRYAGQYSVMSGNLVGGLPVGVQTHFNRDAPYWPAENCYNWKEIWVHPSCRWLMLMTDFIED